MDGDEDGSDVDDAEEDGDEGRNGNVGGYADGGRLGAVELGMERIVGDDTALAMLAGTQGAHAGGAAKGGAIYLE